MAQQSVLGRDFGKRLIRIVLAVVGLLILRAIFGALPMVKNAAALGDSLLTPLVLADAVIDTVIFLLIIGFGVGLGRSIQANYARLPDLGKIVSLTAVAVVLLFAYGSYQTVTACLAESPSDIVKTLSTPSGGVADLQDLMRQVGNMVQNLDQGVMETAIKNAPGYALTGYQMLAVAALKQPPNIYGWTFLILIAIPVVGIVVLVSRNLDAITEMVFHAATAAPGPDAVRGARASGLGVAADGIGPVDAIEKLAKLKGLLDAGVISREEFDGQKAALLGGSQATGEPEELRKLKSLLEAGALTQEEYEIQKRRILAKL